MSLRKFYPLEQLVAVTDERKRQGHRLVFTNGCFDWLHPGHIRLLNAARELGDALIVAVNSDRSVRDLKGPERPLFPENERVEILAALEAVDYVTIFDEPTPLALISRILPHVLVKGADWGPTEVVGREVVEAHGGRVVRIPVVSGYSTSALIETVRRNFKLRHDA